MSTQLMKAAEIAEFDAGSVDMDLLVGALVALKGWVEAAPHLKAIGKRSLCDDFRESGRKRLRLKE